VLFGGAAVGIFLILRERKRRAEILSWSNERYVDRFEISGDKHGKQSYAQASLIAAISMTCLPENCKCVPLEVQPIVVEIGSGMGERARYIAKAAQVQVYAFEENQAICDRGYELTKVGGLEDKVKHVADSDILLDKVHRGGAYCVVSWLMLSPLRRAERRGLVEDVFDLLRPGGVLFGEVLVKSSEEIANDLLTLEEYERVLAIIGFSGFVHINLGNCLKSALIQAGFVNDSIQCVRFICRKPAVNAGAYMYKAPQIRERSTSGTTQRSACVCTRRNSNNLLEVLLIRRRASGGKKWGLPSGGVDPNESSEMAAKREALEEGGVMGEIGTCLGSFLSMSNKTACPRSTTCYILNVVEELDVGLWPESLLRERRWELLGDSSLHKIIKKESELDMLVAAQKHIAVESSF